MTDSTPGCLDTLFELMALPAPTGQEEPVLAWCRDRMVAAFPHIQSNHHGNCCRR